MAREIERKFLVRAGRLPELPPGERLVQGYISRDPEVRFRIAGQRVVLCVKREIRPGERVEIEFPRENLPRQEIDDLHDLALWPPLVKTRSVVGVPESRLVWQVDVYEGDNAGLATAEIELPSLEHPFELPEWVDADAEITTDRRYSNINLTRKPYATWNGR